MEWQDQGIVLSARRHGEGAMILEVLSKTHGRHAGLLRGGAARRHAAMLQSGNVLHLTWRARLEDHLGSFTAELHAPLSVPLLSSRLKLYGFAALASMLLRYLPEREPNGALYDSCIDLLARMGSEQNWQHRYCLMELQILRALGYGLDLERCAVTGQSHDLTHVSPKSGRAVSREIAKGWEDKLLVYPAFLRAESLVDISAEAFGQSLRLSGYFFEKHVPTTPPGLPEARRRFADMVNR